MAIEEKRPSPERDRTNESLRVERQKTNRALVAKQQAVEEDADLVVQHARANADAVLVAARDKADQLDEGGPGTAPPPALVEERALEDEAVRSERAAADDCLRRERDESARALSGLLPLEREKTDRYLLTERARSDGAIANRDDFLGMVSHDLRNLLGGIVLSAAVLEKKAAKDEKDQPTVLGMQRIQRYAARMHRLIGDLVDVTSIDAGKLAVTISSGDSRTLLSEAVDMFHAAASAKGIALEAETTGGPLLAELDRDRMLQVLANGITNAIKFTPSGGHIRLRAERIDGEVRFSIRDTGIGVPPDKLEAIFERFWQLGEADGRGLGLGLYISKCIVHAHGGAIWAESTLGSGCTLYFTLRASRAIP